MRILRSNQDQADPSIHRCHYPRNHCTEARTPGTPPAPRHQERQHPRRLQRRRQDRRLWLCGGADGGAGQAAQRGGHAVLDGAGADSRPGVRFQSGRLVYGHHCHRDGGGRAAAPARAAAAGTADSARRRPTCLPHPHARARVPPQALLLITTTGSPVLKEADRWSAKFKHFLKVALHTDPAKRASSEQLLLVRRCPRAR